MTYTKPELEWIRFDNGDILTQSPGVELPIIRTSEEGDFTE